MFLAGRLGHLGWRVRTQMHLKKGGCDASGLCHTESQQLEGQTAWLGSWVMRKSPGAAYLAEHAQEPGKPVGGLRW